MPLNIQFQPGPGPRAGENPQLAPLDYQLLFRSAPSLLLVLEAAPGFRVLDASNAYLRSRRTTRQAIVGRPFAEAFPPRDRRGVDTDEQAESLERVLHTRTPDSLNTPVFSPDGSVSYIIHRLEAIELEVLRSSRERDDAFRQLEAAKQELEAFAYSASHDLRAPLRTVSGFTSLLRALEANAASPASDYLGRIDAAVRHMASIIDGLLQLSRVERAPIARKQVDVTALARKVLADLQAREPHRRVETQVADAISASADERLIAIALENVLGNAWKYTSRKDPARIEVGSRQVVGSTVFFVKDNGAGFDMARAGNLFKPFSRLHSSTEFEGHGIGLATVRRVIERHGGQVWAESQPGEGATIHFTLS